MPRRITTPALTERVSRVECDAPIPIRNNVLQGYLTLPTRFARIA
jgi:hypothetical protein